MKLAIKFCKMTSAEPSHTQAKLWENLHLTTNTYMFLKSNELNLILGAHMMERENQYPKVVLYPFHACHGLCVPYSHIFFNLIHFKGWNLLTLSSNILFVVGYHQRKSLLLILLQLKYICLGSL